MLDEQSLPVLGGRMIRENSGQILLIDGDLLLKFLGVGRELLQQVLLRPNLLTGVVLSAGLTELRATRLPPARERRS
ncbi:MAG: hypothetical protein WBQ11_17510 [Isosphaeraceae bacterium]